MTPTDASLHGLKLRSVALTVADVDRSVRFYRDVVGLEPMVSSGPDPAGLVTRRSDSPGHLPDADARDTRIVEVGVGARVLISLHERRGVDRAPPTATGLFHLAVLMPSRRALAAFTRHLIDDRTPIVGAADHAVSEAIYLEDPDGHGVEVYADRAMSTWRRLDGAVVMRSDPLDVGALLEAASDPQGDGRYALPADATLGHVHLRVRDVAEASAFYRDTIGLQETASYPGASFLAADGYHHHLGVNAWQSAGGAPPPDDAARLLEVRAGVPSRSLSVLATRLGIESSDGSVRFVDPSGTRWTVGST